MHRIKQREGTCIILRIEYVTDDRAAAGGIINENRFASEIMSRWHIVDVARTLAGPFNVNELIEKFAAVLSSS